MIKLTDLLREASIAYGNTEVYASTSLDGKYVDLFKVKDFPAIKKGSDAFANGTFRTMLDKIIKRSWNMSLDEYLSEMGEESTKKDTNDEIAKLTSFHTVYVYPDEDMIFITNSLDRFSGKYKTEEGWGLGKDREWVKI
jgi:hypothetical protein